MNAGDTRHHPSSMNSMLQGGSWEIMRHSYFEFDALDAAGL